MNNEGKLSIEKTIGELVLLFKKNADPKLIYYILLNDGYSKQRADTMLRWSYQIANQENKS